jgi:hypothetical protein
VADNIIREAAVNGPPRDGPPQPLGAEGKISRPATYERTSIRSSTCRKPTSGPPSTSSNTSPRVTSVFNASGLTSRQLASS